ncbi:TLR4 interactor with leucine rich repeats-like [Zophobas morio]|uniref:TLR4 interactor with leucine rich repeats-like n=1 Tax=Zophobas morio TaxID=2755281 RepID=UPI00308326A9
MRFFACALATLLGKNVLTRGFCDEPLDCYCYPTLDLSLCSLKVFPFNNKSLSPEIKKLLLKNNKLTHIAPDAFIKLTLLSTLDLSYNKLTSINRQLLLENINLEKLYLNGNLINSLEDGTFQNLNKLNYLTLDGNPLRSVKSNWFEGLSGLRSLSLRNIKITSVPTLTFQELSSLTFLDLEYNKITVIGVNAFYSTLERILINSDPSFLCCSRLLYQSRLRFTSQHCTYLGDLLLYNNVTRNSCTST